MTPWITIVGIGDDGLDGLSPAARALVASAEVLVGGDRHQAMVTGTAAERLTWDGGLAPAMERIAEHRGRRVVVLVSGDPMYYGAGANLTRRFDPAEITVVPYPGAFSFAAARLLWSLADVETLTVHGRALSNLNLVLAPGVRILVLSWNGDTPAAAAALLTERGFGPSAITVFEHLGGPRERRIDATAESWIHPRCADLNTLAVECRVGGGARVLTRVPGLPDDVFESDGQITKREVRAATMAALAPLPGQVLWDVGAGSGSVAIEWLRSVPRYRIGGGAAAAAIAVERDAGRCAAIARNAAALGVPQIEVVHGEAPDVLTGLGRQPNTVFLGGGVAQPGLLDACWSALSAGGRLVANAVTVEGEARLVDFRKHHGGDLVRIAISRAEPVGRLSGFRPLMPVTQYGGTKS